MDLNKASAFNAIVWLLNNKIVNENNSLVEFKDHAFLIDPYLDETPKQVARKCLHPKTKILTSDFRWISIGDISVGQGILSVDEIGRKRKYRRMRIGIVENKFFSNKKAFRLTFDDSRIIVASLDHRFLCKRRGTHDLEWRKLENIRVGDSIRSVVSPWGKPDYESGWFGGFIDGEGTIRRRDKYGGIELSLTQIPGTVLERAKDYLNKNNIYYKESIRAKSEIGKKEVRALRISSSVDIMKILGLTRPSRFINKESLWNDAIPPIKQSHSKVTNIEKLPVQQMVDIRTSTRTFLAEGLITHNCSQIGWSTLAILRSFHLAKHAGANIIHTFPSRNMSKEFVQPKVDPLIEKNDVIRKMIGVDSMNLKQVGDRFIYYRGSYEEREAISISAHILINDEYDRSDQKVLKIYKSRLDDAKRERPELGWEWQFSNPTVPGRGVDDYWQRSDQKHWFVKCSRCNYFWYMRWPESINKRYKFKMCSRCHKKLKKEDLQNGQWVKKYRDRKISGYWVSQLFVPWISAEKIIDDSKGDPEIFYNFTLGLPYISKDTSVTRSSIIRCLSPGFNPKTSVAIGVDNGIEKHYVIGNKTGVFEIGKTKDWEKIEELRNKYNAVMVIDALPYPHIPQKLTEKYSGKVFIHYYQQDRKRSEVVKWDQRVVRSDRTKVIDSVVANINAGDQVYYLTQTELEEYIHHWEQIYRVIEDNPQGIAKPKWRTIEGRPDHYCLNGRTTIETLRGRVPIKNVTVGDFVLTRDGYKRVYRSWMTQKRAKVFKYKFSDGSFVVATPEHKVYTKNRDFVALHSIVPGDKIVTCNTTKRLFFRGLHTADTLIQKTGLTELISLQGGQVGGKVAKDFIKKFGNLFMEKFQWGMQFITKMIIPSTTIFPIFPVFQGVNINQNMLKKGLKVNRTGKKTSNILTKLDHSPMRGGKQKKERGGIWNMQRKHSFCKSRKGLFVLSVKNQIQQLLGMVASFVQESVYLSGTEEIKELTPVYNLSVEDNHEYFANGLLVSNCHATVYFTVALERTLSVGGIVKAPSPKRRGGEHPVVSQSGTVKALNLHDVVERAKKRKFR